MGLVQPLIQTSSLTKRYGSVIALDSVSLQVFPGIRGLLGANGAGKSTAMKIFLGLVKPTSGAVGVLGQSPRDLIAARARISYMPEYDCLPSDVSGSEFLTLMAQAPLNQAPPETAVN